MFEQYRLDAADHQRVSSLWNEIRGEKVGAYKALTTAIRRFGLAGERSRAEDQIIDLMIAAEAIFLPRESTESAHKLSLRAGLFLQTRDESAREIAFVMKRAYNARSKLAHGGEIPALRWRDGTDATLAEYVERVSQHLRDALCRLIRATAAGDPVPSKDWDDFTFASLDAQRAPAAEAGSGSWWRRSAR